MDNQFYQQGMGNQPQQPMGQPGGYVPQQTSSLRPPVGYAPEMNMNPPQGYAGMPMQDPYGMQQGVQDPYAAQQGIPGVTGEFQPYSGQMGQQPYAPGYQQPYSQDGYQHLFDPNQPMVQPPMGFPPVEPKRSGTNVRAIVLSAVGAGVALVALLVILGVFVFGDSSEPLPQYGTVGVGSLSASHTGDCLIVRNEVPYDADAVTTVLYLAEEGSTVHVEDEICKVYSSGYSTSEVKTLQKYQAQIRDYQKNLLETETTYDARLNRVTTDVETLAREVRDLIGGARGSLANQEELLQAAITARQEYLKTKYAADQRFSRLYDDEKSQSQRIDSWTSEKKAVRSGVVSFYSDGFEYGLTVDNYTSFEPVEVREMINGKKPEKTSVQKSKTTIYRMVTDGEWYVLFLSKDTDWNPVNGAVYDLQLEHFASEKVRAEVVSFTRSGGELLVRLKVNSPVKPVLYMRTCEAVLGENMTTLLVDKRAIFEQDGMQGVVLSQDGSENFVPVNVIYEQDGMVYIQPVQQGMLNQNATIRLF